MNPHSGQHKYQKEGASLTVALRSLKRGVKVRIPYSDLRMHPSDCHWEAEGTTPVPEQTQLITQLHWNGAAFLSPGSIKLFGNPGLALSTYS